MRQQIAILKKKLEKRLCVKHINDYISSPKYNGYRSLHLIVSLSENDSKTIEIQLRCLHDHNWATLVEITDLVYGTRIKELGNDSELAEFHRLLSFAYDSNLSTERKIRIVNIANTHSYFKRISEIFSKNYIEVRNKWNASKLSKNNFYLISTDSTGSPEITSFRTFESAEKAYFETYLDNPGNKNIVLTHIKDASFDAILSASKILLERSKARFAVLKLGERGCSVWDGKELKIIPAYPSKVVDTTAAGDCFTAAMALEFIRSKDIISACEMGNRAGSIAVSRMGAEASMPTINELNKFIR